MNYNGYKMDFGKFFIAERNQMPLFAPVILGSGIIFGVYFPATNLYLLIGIIASFVVIIIFVWKISKFLTYIIFIFLLGFYIAQTGGILETNMLIHKQFIEREYDNIEFQAIVSSMDETHPVMANMRRIELKNVQIANLEFIKTVKMTCSKRMTNDIYPGNIIIIKGKLSPFKPPAIPSSFDQLQYNSLVGIDANGIAYSIKKIGSTDSFVYKLSKIRNKLTKNIIKTFSNNISGGIASALITGDKSAIPREVREKFIKSGTAHILAISGLHMSCIASIVFFVLHKLLMYISYFYGKLNSKTISAILTIPITFLYLSLSGFSPSATRAFIMTSIFLISIIFGKGCISLRNVAVSAFVILLFNPATIFLVSFQLSFSAVVALISFYEKFQYKFEEFKIKYNGFCFKFCFYIFVTLMSTIIASIATLPISISVFNRFSFSGMIGNLIAIPCISFVIIPLCIISMLSFKLSMFFVNILDFAISKLYVILSFISSLPYSNIIIKSPETFALYLIVFGGIIVCLFKTKLRSYGTIPIFIGTYFWIVQKSPNIIYPPNKEIICFVEYGKLYTTSLKKGRNVAYSIQRNLGLTGKIEKYLQNDFQITKYKNGLYIWSDENVTKYISKSKHPYCPAFFCCKN